MFLFLQDIHVQLQEIVIFVTWTQLRNLNFYYVYILVGAQNFLGYPLIMDHSWYKLAVNTKVSQLDPNELKPISHLYSEAAMN